MVVCFIPTIGIAVNNRESDLTKTEVFSQDYTMDNGS